MATTSETTPARTITLASRASQLAKIQTYIVRDALVGAFPSPSASSSGTPTSQKYTFETAFMSTAGDKNQAQALYVLGGAQSGGKSLWTEELEAALLTEDAGGRVDMLVHSLKDVPTALPPGCSLGAILKREDPVDSLVMKKGSTLKSLDELPDGSVVGTSSVRRQAQLKRRYPKLTFMDVRGNLNTRLAKLDAPDGPYAALILAKAGVVRMGWGERITADLSAPILYHAVGQGALGVEIRAGDAEVAALCEVLNDRDTEWTCRAERALLRVLEGGCSVPVGTHTTLTPVGETGRALLTIAGTVTSLDGTQHVEATLEEEVGSAPEAEGVGAKLAHKLMEDGATAILEEIARDKEARRKAEGIA